MRRLICWAIGLALVLTGCVAPRVPYDAADAASADVGIAGARTWGDVPDAGFRARARSAIQARGGASNYLALSGGGGDGAFGAGILNGWTRSGSRPEFTIVSGVSTGSLIAPFAFLGSRYDPMLTEFYTSGVAETLLANPDILAAVFGSSIFSNDRLRELVSRYVTPELVAEVARESARGRLLLVLTTNLDSQRPVLWDMGAIARDGSPKAVALFRDVLVASASIPAVFPPMLIDATANGHAFEELHVDGSVASNVFTLPRSYLQGSERSRDSVRGGRIFILLNTSPLPAFAATENRTASIVGRTISMGFQGQVRSDLASTYEASKRLGFEFNLTYIDEPASVEKSTDTQIGFDTARMRRLYDMGFERARSGNFWRKRPPDLGGGPTVAPKVAEAAN